MRIFDVAVYDKYCKGFMCCDRNFTDESKAHEYAKQMLKEKVSVTADVMYTDDNDTWHTIVRYGRKHPSYNHKKTR